MSKFFPYRFDSFSEGIGVQKSKQSQKFSPLRKLLLIFKAHSFPIKISDFKTKTKHVLTKVMHKSYMPTGRFVPKFINVFHHEKKCLYVICEQ